MKRYRYIKSNAFTVGASLGNPAACVFMGEETLSPLSRAVMIASSTL